MLQESWDQPSLHLLNVRIYKEQEDILIFMKHVQELSIAKEKLSKDVKCTIMLKGNTTCLLINGIQPKPNFVACKERATP